jgi:hypothetical protein
VLHLPLPGRTKGLFALVQALVLHPPLPGYSGSMFTDSRS